MTSVDLNYTKGQLDNAGRILADLNSSKADSDLAFDVVNYWRSMHIHPLNTFQMTLRRKAKDVDNQCLIAQRIKRLSSIQAKLRNFPRMRLSRMQDIGGCRVVVGSVAQVNILVRRYEKSDLKHKLVKTDNYIAEPKLTGYRGVHIVYSYFSDKHVKYNGLKVEMQFRSQLQHAWATAVETVGTFMGQPLKANQGSEEWLRFFTLMGTEIAFREGSPVVPGTPGEKRDWRAELKSCASELNVINLLRGFGAALRTLELNSHAKTPYYFLLVLRPSDNSISISGYDKKDFDRAASDYIDIERASQQTSVNAVLVSVQSIDSLRRAYPNYFLDTKVFIDVLQSAIR